MSSYFSPMGRAVLVACGLLTFVVGACDGSEESLPTTTTTAQHAASPADRADAYARERSGGETEGCSRAAPGEEETTPGCVYAVAFAGCHDGITGEQLSPLPVEEEFPDSPALHELYGEAMADCGEGG